MATNLLLFLTIGIVACHAALPPQLYWESMLPNTPMPKSVRDILQSDIMDQKSTSVTVGKGGVDVDAGKGKPGGTAVNVGKGGVDVNSGKGKPGGTSVNVGKGGVDVNSGKGKPGGTAVNVGKGGVDVNSGKGKPGGTAVNVGKGGVDVNSGKGKPGGTSVNVGKGGVNTDAGNGRTKVGVGKGGVTVHAGRKGKPVYVGVGTTGPSPFVYNYAATKTQLHDNPDVALFFLEKDLHNGTKMNLHITRDSNAAMFLPRQVAESVPFSSTNLPEILNYYSVVPGSPEAQTIKNTLKACEEPSIAGEDKYCATSLESMIDFSTSKLGRNVEAISTEVEKETPKQKYTITAGMKQMTGDKAVVCHKQNYAYAVFYCHTTKTTKAFTVPLEAADGTKAKAVAVCHTDTSAWNPKHLAFQVLKVKPGTSSVCHFLPENHIVWVPK